ncbi:MAG: tetratricopeptide repeat protein [Gammaproteobacteria bacterium]
MYYNRYFSLIAFLLLVGCASGPTTTKKPVSLNQDSITGAPDALISEYKKALKDMQAGRYESAKKRLNKLTFSYPNYSGPYANLGIIYYNDGNLTAAEIALNKAIEINKKNAMAHNQLGIIYRSQGEFEKARTSYRKAIQIDPQYALAYYNLGILYELYLRDFRRAVEYYKQYQKYSPEKDKLVASWIRDLEHRIKAKE